MKADTLITEVAISDEEFQKFREFFYRKTGISFEPPKRYFVDKRLLERIEATGSGNFHSYFTMLRFQASGEELQQLTNLMTVNETYFLREEYHFQCLVDSMLPEITSRKIDDSSIRIWSIPSSSGEEPYSIAVRMYHRNIFESVGYAVKETINGIEALEKALQKLSIFTSWTSICPSSMATVFCASCVTRTFPRLRPSWCPPKTRPMIRPRPTGRGPTATSSSPSNQYNC